MSILKKFYIKWDIIVVKQKIKGGKKLNVCMEIPSKIKLYNTNRYGLKCIIILMYQTNFPFFKLKL